MKEKANRLIFVHAPEVYYEQNYGARFPPIWAYTLAAYVPEEWDISVCDCTVMDKSEIPEATVFAFSGINQDFHAIKSTHGYLKANYPSAKFVLGGPITWSYEQDGRLNELAFFDHLFILDGEYTLPRFLSKVARGEYEGIEKVIRSARVSLQNARKLRFDLFKLNASKYYGGVIEVSRGCPFLCEFCDIRVLPNNNEAHNKSIALIVEELDQYYKLGVRQIQLACDNFIGDLVWARQCVVAILDWVNTTGAQVALYTWITINVSRMPELMKTMRLAGFTSLFIGVESFNAHSILEMAKVQNKNDKGQMEEAIRGIQSFGFIVLPGLILGFDSDPPTMFDDMLAGVTRSGLIGGDPTFLLALPGTPLYARMKRTKRLVEYDQTGRTVPIFKERVSKVESNMKFLQPSSFLVKGYMKFIKQLTSPKIQYERFRRHVSIMMESELFVPVHSIGYGSLPEYLKFQFSSLINFRMLCKRLFKLFRPANLATVIKAYCLVLRYRPKYRGLKNHFTFWLFSWSNLLIKYEDLREEDFKIHSIAHDYDLNSLWKDVECVEPSVRSGRYKDDVKAADQARSTREALRRLKERLGVSYSLSDFR